MPLQLLPIVFTILTVCDLLCVSLCFRKILFGSMTVTSFSNEEARESLAPPTSDFLARCTQSVKLTTDSEACCLYPDKGNIHEITASE